MIDFVETNAEIMPTASIKVIGVGGAGGNTVNSILASGISKLECIVANTDAQALSLSKAHHTVHIGVKSTKGLGTGANPDLGKRAAEEDLDKVLEVIGDADIVFLTAGMGGGTGSGALPVIARTLKEKNILSIAIVTKPFIFEGKRRAAVAEKAIETLRKEVDTLIIIPNQKLLEVVDAHVSMIDAFSMINDVLSKSVKGISDIITKPGHINVDFADVKTIMKDMGLAVMGTGSALGQARSQQATLKAISSPLLENMSIKGARGVLLNITGGSNLSLHEISQAASIVYEQAHEDATIILGSVIDESMTDEVAVTIIATGFADQEVQQKDVVINHHVPEAQIMPAQVQPSILQIKDNQRQVQDEESVHSSSCGRDAKLTDEKKEELVKVAHSFAVGSETDEQSQSKYKAVHSSECKEHEQKHDIMNCVAQGEQKIEEQEQIVAARHIEYVEQKQEIANAPIDMHDLDVPTFLRKDVSIEK